MNFQQKVYTAKELMQKICDNGGTPYEPDTFHYDRGMGWEVHTDYDYEISWQDFSYRSHETGLTVYRNLNEIVRYLREELKSTTQKSTNHIEFIGDFEFFTSNDGALFRARRTNAFDTSGFRLGGRFEAPAHMIETMLETHRSFAELDS